MRVANVQSGSPASLALLLAPPYAHAHAHAHAHDGHDGCDGPGGYEGYSYGHGHDSCHLLVHDLVAAMVDIDPDARPTAAQVPALLRILPLEVGFTCLPAVAPPRNVRNPSDTH